MVIANEEMHGPQWRGAQGPARGEFGERLRVIPHRPALDEAPRFADPAAQAGVGRAEDADRVFLSQKTFELVDARVATLAPEAIGDEEHAGRWRKQALPEFRIRKMREQADVGRREKPRAPQVACAAAGIKGAGQATEVSETAREQATTNAGRDVGQLRVFFVEQHGLRGDERGARHRAAEVLGVMARHGGLDREAGAGERGPQPIVTVFADAEGGVEVAGARGGGARENHARAGDDAALGE